MLPLTLTVTGGRAEQTRCAEQTLRAALPRAVVHVHDRVAETLDEVSANSHLVVALAEAGDGAPTGSSDAVVSTCADLDEFVSRARAFDRRRRRHELPPDLPPSIEPWSAAWSPAARRVGARVSTVLTSRGVTADVDHIGSTSVPGLAAKAILDLQVSVASLDAVDDALRAAGFVNVQQIVPDAPGVRSDNPRGSDAGGDQWEKRLYAGVDAAQRTIVHVRRVGAANWRYALLFRDWLRSDDEQRDAYARVKVDLADAHHSDADFDDYARAKDYWFDSAYEASEAWAARTGWQLSLPNEGCARVIHNC